MNNRADKLANEGRLKGRTMNLGSLTVPAGWVDTAPVLCHQPLNYLTSLVIRSQVGAPTKTIKFESFSDRWTVSLGFMFGVVLDPGDFIKKVWSLTVPEGLKEVLWKEMNGAQVIGHRYYGRGHAKSDLGRHCSCGVELTLGHVLVGCTTYNLHPLMNTLLVTLKSISSTSGFKTLSPDEWGVSLWYPLLALKELEEIAYPIVKGRKKILKNLKRTRQKQEWTIGNYYWALWKWRMKEIHDTNFTFIPLNCVLALTEILMTPVPPHLLTQTAEEGDGDLQPQDRPAKQHIALTGDLTKLPPPVSHLSGGGAGARLTNRGKSILRAIQAPQMNRGPCSLPRREAILQALTDDAYA